MDITKLRGDNREAHGKRQAQRLRREGKVPGVIYGHGQEPRNVAVDFKGLENALEHGAHIIELNLDGRPQPVLIKQVQFEPVSQAPLHVDFVWVDLNERVVVSVPLEFRGTPVGLHEGGLFEEHLVDLEIEALASKIPDSIRVNVNDLQVGQSLRVSDLDLPAGATPVTAGETVICAVRAKAVSPEEEEAAELAAEEGEVSEPELIRREKEKEGGEAS